MNEKILILDFGSQYTQLIARSVREANVYCEIIPYHQKIVPDPSLKGIILSGSPFSVNDPKAPMVDVKAFTDHSLYWEFVMVPSLQRKNLAAG